MEKTLNIWKEIGDGFLKLTKEELSKKLKELGYRFYNKRAEYIIEARNKIDLLEEILKMNNEFEIREKLVENFKGIGWKEASHFLRNLGYKNFAIIDRHVLKTLKEFGIIEDIPRALNRKNYLGIEDKLREIAKELNMSLAELDFYLFYLSARMLPIK
jgi:N-glycosylase/DNA lyase